MRIQHLLYLNTRTQTLIFSISSNGETRLTGTKPKPRSVLILKMSNQTGTKKCPNTGTEPGSSGIYSWFD